MNYPCIEINALYNIKTGKVDIKLTFLDSYLKSINNEYLDTSGKYLKPCENVVEEVHSHYMSVVEKEKIRKIIPDNVVSDYEKIGVFEIQVGLAYLDSEGKVDFLSHYEEYNFNGPSQSHIKELLTNF